jgi:hypothetical protein
VAEVEFVCGVVGCGARIQQIGDLRGHVRPRAKGRSMRNTDRLGESDLLWAEEHKGDHRCQSADADGVGRWGADSHDAVRVMDVRRGLAGCGDAARSLFARMPATHDSRLVAAALVSN